MLAENSKPIRLCATAAFEGGFLPSDVDGATAPADGTAPLFIALHGQNGLRAYELQSLNFAAKTATIASSDMAVAPFAQPCGTIGICMPREGAIHQLDAFGNRLMNRLGKLETCNMESPQPGMHYSSVEGVRAFNGVTFTARDM